MKITVAIPVYNAARHLKVTLNSLIHQTMNESDFEIICVNDMSTDNSVEVIESFMREHANIQLINRTENAGGPMIPRNNAIDEAKGDYILFLDNDDFLGEEALERFYNAAMEYNSDVIFGKYVGVNGRVVPQSMFKNGNVPNADIVSSNMIYSLAPHKMFKLSFIREHEIRFDPRAVVGEDQLFVMHCNVKAKVITILSDYDYYYVVSRGDENLSLKYFPAKNFFFSFHNIMRILVEADLSPLYKTRLQAAFLNRFFHASRLRSYLFSNLLTEEQKREWLNETKTFIDAHITEEIMELIPSRFHYFILVARENNLNKLLMVHKQMDLVSPNNVTKVKNGWIYGKFQNLSKNLSYEDEYPVNHLNTSEVFLTDLFFQKTGFNISGQFTQSLLINYDAQYSLRLVHRKTEIEKILYIPKGNFGKEKFEFEVDYKEILFDSKLVGPWDVFIVSEVNGYNKRRRIGKDRSTARGSLGKKTSVQSFGKTFSIKPYFTTPHDNISFDVKLDS